MLLAVGLRAPFWGAPLTADEGGYGEVARLWSQGARLYRDAWADRPQGLLLVFRAVGHLYGGSVETMRAVAAVTAALVLLATMLVTLRLAGRITALAAALLMATAGASPFVESFTLSGELLASLPAVLSLLAFTAYLRLDPPILAGRMARRGRLGRFPAGLRPPEAAGARPVRFAFPRLAQESRLGCGTGTRPRRHDGPPAITLIGGSRLRDRRAWLLLLAGVLTGCAVMVKQSAFDAGLAAVVLLLWRDRLAGLARAALLVAGAAVPVAAGALFAPSAGDWWFAVAGYRGAADSLFTGSPAHRWHLFASSLPAAARGLALLALLAAAGWRTSPVLARLWLAAAAVGVVGGGNFHAHYYVQLVPPLSLLAGIGAVSLRRLAPLTAAAAAASVLLAAPLWGAGPARQARAIWPSDPHLRHDAALASYVKAHTSPGQRVYVLWAAADVYYLAGRPPAFRYLWYRNVQAIGGALEDVRWVLAGRRPALVAVVQAPGSLDRSGRTARILARDYRLVARVEGVSVYAPL